VTTWLIFKLESRYRRGWGVVVVQKKGGKEREGEPGGFSAYVSIAPKVRVEVNSLQSLIRYNKYN
jgi:hypothetical protein